MNDDLRGGRNASAALTQDRADEILAIEAELAALRSRRKPIADALVEALAEFERVVTENGFDVDLSCGVATHGGHIPWRYSGIDVSARLVAFEHECSEHSYSENYDYGELWVPLLFFARPDDWVLLTALAGKAAR